MRSFTLRKFRIVASFLFLIIFGAAFLDIHHSLPTSVVNYILYFQFIPSVFNFFNTYTLIATGFIIVLFLVVLFGRVYCSSICPIGTIQDISSNISRKVHRRKKYNFSEEFRWLRYTVLIITVIFIFSGNLLLINLLDPYSNAGRIFAQLVNPIFIAGNNFLSSVLVSFDIYSIYPIDPKSYSYLLAIFPLVFLFIILYLSFRRGRLYCNTICPVGTLLGFFSRFSLYKLKIDKTGCEGCGVCVTVCKSECINFQTKEIDFTLCVACYNCIDVCPSEVISYTNSWKDTTSSEEKDSSKREFLSKTFLYVLGLTGISLSQIKVIPEKESTVPVHRKLNLSPPGSTSLDHYNSTCTACHLCITACPTKVLQPSFLEFGFLGILQPYMDFKTSFCNYDCVVCLEVCPTGAIQTLTPEKKKTVQIGKAIFVKENCIVETEKKACGACSEHCPTKAVDMVFYKDDLKIPEVTEKYCIGCGACEYACPTFPYKAIYVEGNYFHKEAEKKKLEQIEFEFDPREDFPF